MNGTTENIEKLIELELIKVQVECEGKKGNKLWTDSVKNHLAELGNSLNYSICGSGLTDHEREWLYDLVWYKEKNVDENARLNEVGLVVECEWDLHFEQIKYDFEKLLLSNSKHRLMICSVSEDRKPWVKNYFKEAIECYEQGHLGDRYLIAILDVDTEEFEFEILLKK